MNETKKSASHRDDLMAEIAGQSFVQKDRSLCSPYLPRAKGTQGSPPSLSPDLEEIRPHPAEDALIMETLRSGLCPSSQLIECVFCEPC